MADEEANLSLYKNFGRQMKYECKSAGGTLKAISVLQEVLVKYHMVPTYTLEETTGFDHASSFTYKAYINDHLYAFGKSGTKQTAKHISAINLMQHFIRLSEDGTNEDGLPSPPSSTSSSRVSINNARTSPSSTESVATTTNNYQHVEPVLNEEVPLTNCIGLVQEWCQQRRIQLPVYVQESQEGESHQPTFTTSCSLQYGITPDSVFKTVASASNKKTAKKIAAHKMWQLLVSSAQNNSQSKLTGPSMSNPIVVTPPKQSPQPKFSTSETPTSCLARMRMKELRSQLQIEKYDPFEVHPVNDVAEMKAQSNQLEDPTSSVVSPAVVCPAQGSPKTLDRQEVLQELQQTLEEANGEELLRLKVGATNQNENPVRTLWKLCEELEVEMDFLRTDDFTDDGQVQCMVQLCFPVHRTFFVCFGIGESVSKARDGAARNTITCLRAMASGSKVTKEDKEE